MKNFKMFLLVPAAILAVACNGNDNKKVDDALNSDLTLAAQARPYTAMDSISAAERAYAAQGLAPVGYAPAGAVVSQPAKTRVVYRDRPVYRSSSSSGTYSAPRRTTVVKHTKRDAAIGGAAGAVIGAVTSKDKVKGAVVGGVAGAILGGVLGNNVDKTRR
ncbi:MAG: YMGG-like glycine zipper-containing protein [Gemmatimonadales bacterium]